MADETIAAAFQFYLTDAAGVYELKNDPKAYALLTDYLKRISSDLILRAQVMAWLPHLHGNTSLFGFSDVALSCGDAGSPRRALLQAVERLYISTGDPASLAALLSFRDADCDELRGPAMSENYGSLSTLDWAIPESAFFALEHRVQRSDELSNNRINLGLPRHVRYMMLDTWRHLAILEEGTRAAGRPTPSGTFALAEPQAQATMKKAGLAILHQLSTAYGINITPALATYGESGELFSPPELMTRDEPAPYFFPEMVLVQVEVALEAALIAQKESEPIAKALAARIASREFERRAVLAYSILVMSVRRPVGHKEVTFENLDERFENFVAALNSRHDIVLSTVSPLLRKKRYTVDLPPRAEASLCGSYRVSTRSIKATTMKSLTRAATTALHIGLSGPVLFRRHTLLT